MSRARFVGRAPRYNSIYSGAKTSHDAQSRLLKLVQEAKRRVRECSVSDVQTKRHRGEVFHFIDVREDHEYDREHAQGAVHLGKGIIERDIETLVPNKEDRIVLYCGGGFRSVLAADSLQQMGYRNVESMAGGFKAWREAALPIQKGSRASESQKS